MAIERMLQEACTAREAQNKIGAAIIAARNLADLMPTKRTARRKGRYIVHSMPGHRMVSRSMSRHCASDAKIKRK